MTETVYDHRNGVKRSVITDPDKPSEFTVKTSQDMEPILDSVARDREIMRNDGPNKLLARVPMYIYERSCHEAWDEDDWKRWLNSPEAEPFRVWKGQV